MGMVVALCRRWKMLLKMPAMISRTSCVTTPAILSTAVARTWAFTCPLVRGILYFAFFLYQHLHYIIASMSHFNTETIFIALFVVLHIIIYIEWLQRPIYRRIGDRRGVAMQMHSLSGNRVKNLTDSQSGSINIKYLHNGWTSICHPDIGTVQCYA